MIRRLQALYNFLNFANRTELKNKCFIVLKGLEKDQSDATAESWSNFDFLSDFSSFDCAINPFYFFKKERFIFSNFFCLTEGKVWHYKKYLR